MHPKFTLTLITLSILFSVSAHGTDYDYDGDGKADVAVRRASNSYWYVQNSDVQNFNSEQQDGIQRTQFGLQSSDIPVPADYDGDGITDFAVRRPSTFTWYVRNSSGDNTNSERGDGVQRQVFGRDADDIPVPADYDGDGIADFAVRRPSTFTWYIRNSNGTNFNSDVGDGIQRIVFGRDADDTPVTGDFDNDGKADIAVWRASTATWYIKNSSGENDNSSQEDGIQRIVWGSSTDIPVPADYDGDGITDIAVRTPSTFTWTIRRSSDGATQTHTFGRDAEDIPVPADYDGDGKADIAVRRSSNQFFYILNSTDGEIQRINFGKQEDDIPTNASVPNIISKLEEVNNVAVDNTGGNSNTAPVASAGSDQSAETGATVQLDGSVSSDADGDSLGYSWSFSSMPPGSSASLSHSNTAMPSFVADKAGTFVLSLVVNDGVLNSHPDSVTITVTDPEPQNTAPVANAGADQTVEQGATVQLNGSGSSDADGDTLSYSWSFVSRPSGSSASLNSTTRARPSFVADEAGIYSLSLIVSDGVASSAADSVTITATAAEPASTWIINTDGTLSNYIQASDSSLGALVNVESVTTETIDNSEYTKVIASGIPDYEVLATEELISSLNSRPRARRDFGTGETTARQGDTIQFGEDIGYNSNSSCNTGAGYGYWPPGPVCPEDLDREGYFPNEPQTTEEECDTGLGAIGFIVNGTSVYNWGDGMSYNSEGVWFNLAPVAEQYDVDICGGHAANGDYHHHFYSSCLADLVGDKGDGHSPLYGYAADGYPIYGPWEAEGQLAISSWVVRDYSAGSDTGCGTDGERSCIMTDSYDPSRGTETASSNGPDVGDEVTTASGNTLAATAGFYKQDYYWDSSLTARGGAYLDQYNAHYDDVRGYHYHITVTDDHGTLSPYFPFMIGDRYAGQLQDNAISSCSRGTGGGPGGGGPGGPGGPG